MKRIWKFSLQSGGHYVSPQFGNKNPSYQFVGGGGGGGGG